MANAPCKPNCEHKPDTIKSEGCGVYHDQCPVYQGWKSKHTVAMNIKKARELMSNARMPVKAPRSIGRKTSGSK